MKKLLPLLALILCGCANIVHNRTVSTDINGVRTVVETESARFFFQKEAAQRINVATTDNATNYHHTVSALGVQATGDVELINAIGNAVGKGIAAGVKGAAGVP